MATVLLKNVHKTYKGGKAGDVTAVRDLSLEIGDKEFAVLVGPSGCGKSTTLRMIAGLEEPSKGDIFIDDRRINQVPPKDRDIAMVFQNYALYPHLSVFENMAFSLKLRKYSKPEIWKRVSDAAGILDIEGLLDRKPAALSGGQRQRVAVGRAVVRQPKVFLFDEPLSNLDASLRVRMRNEITGLHRRLRVTMIYVTHDQSEAMTMGDRIVVMRDGTVQQMDAPIPLYINPENMFVGGFLGSPPMNFIHGTLGGGSRGGTFREKDGGTIQLNLSGHPAVQSHAGKQVVLGIRPEDISLVTGEDASGGDAFQAVVEVVEPMGAETHFHLQTGAHTAIARCHIPADHSGVGRRLRFHIARDRVHLFDPATTLRIR